MKVYLAGPINGCADDEASSWRDDFIRSHPGATCLDPMRRDYRGIEDDHSAEIVLADLVDIEACDVVVVNSWKASWGTAMELVYAYRWGKRIVAVVPKGTPVSPWLKYHATEIVSELAKVKL